MDLDSDPFYRPWTLLMSVCRRDIAYCIAIAREPDAEHELDDLPDWAVEEALRLSDDAMKHLTSRVSGHLYDDQQFYSVVGFVYDQWFRPRSG